MPPEQPQLLRRQHGPLHHGGARPLALLRDEQLPVGTGDAPTPRAAQRGERRQVHQHSPAQGGVGPRQVPGQQRRRHLRQGGEEVQQTDSAAVREAQRGLHREGGASGSVLEPVSLALRVLGVCARRTRFHCFFSKFRRVTPPRLNF